MKKILYLLFALLAAGLASCNSDNKNDITGGIPADALYDIVTLSATTENATTFTVQKDENSSPVQYICSVSLLGDKNFTVGTRMIIAYTMLNGAQPYTTGAITLYGYAHLSNTEPDVLVGSSEAYGGWATEPLKLNAMTLTGNYLNVYAQMFTNSYALPTRYILVADETTIDKPVVETYLILKSNLPDGSNLANIYASFNLSEIFEKETCRKVKVNYLSITGSGSKEFNAPQASIRPID